MTTLRILSTLAVMGAMRELTAEYQRRCQAQSIDQSAGLSTGQHRPEFEASFSPTVALLQRLRAGEAADIAILTAQGIDDLIAEGIIRAGTRTDIALSFVGVAIRAGTPKPDIGSVEALKRTLLAARSVAYSRIGASGIFFAGLLDRLGIAAEVNARAVLVPSGLTAERTASGEAELAVQQISELLVVPGIEVVGPLPAEVQTMATFSAGLLSKSCQSAEAAALLHFLASPEIAPILRRAGLEPPDQDSGTHYSSRLAKPGPNR
jgi:molybdate transport system substrate-binding protein